MRQVVLDTETTGLEPKKGHRVVEIGCIELIERRPSGRQFQRYLNPQRPMDRGAQEITGLSDEFLVDKPLFADIADEFLEFIRGAELIIHNAAFDVGFLDAELQRLARGGPSLREMCPVIDSLQLARERYPGQRNSLDALCRRLQVDASHRTLHGALLDAQLLVDVYLNLTAGQGDLGFGPAVDDAARVSVLAARAASVAVTVRLRPASAGETALHDARVQRMRAAGACLWPVDEYSTHEAQPVVA